MGYDLIHNKLTGKKGNFRFNMRGWRMALELAFKYGWKPEGTITIENMLKDDNSDTFEILYPEDKNWNNTYFRNDFQNVSDSDASNLGKALKRAIAKKKKLKSLSHEDIIWIDGLDRFANYCLAGGFFIN